MLRGGRLLQAKHLQGLLLSLHMSKSPIESFHLFFNGFRVFFQARKIRESMVYHLGKVDLPENLVSFCVNQRGQSGPDVSPSRGPGTDFGASAGRASSDNRDLPEVQEARTAVRVITELPTQFALRKLVYFQSSLCANTTLQNTHIFPDFLPVRGKKNYNTSKSILLKINFNRISCNAVRNLSTPDINHSRIIIRD